MPTLTETFEDYMAANTYRASGAEILYHDQIRYSRGDWLTRPLNAISQQNEVLVQRIAELLHHSGRLTTPGPAK